MRAKSHIWYCYSPPQKMAGIHFVGQRVLCVKTMVLGAKIPNQVAMKISSLGTTSKVIAFAAVSLAQGEELTSCYTGYTGYRLALVAPLESTTVLSQNSNHPARSPWRWCTTCRISQKMSNVLWTRKLSSLSVPKCQQHRSLEIFRTFSLSLIRMLM